MDNMVCKLQSMKLSQFSGHSVQNISDGSVFDQIRLTDYNAFVFIFLIDNSARPHCSFKQFGFQYSLPTISQKLKIPTPKNDVTQNFDRFSSKRKSRRFWYTQNYN